MAGDSFYVTTPIYYVNDVPHIGHAYTTVAADAIARYKRLAGKRVFFLTGTDEHGQKVERTAAEHGETPQQLADRVVERFKGLWGRLNISNDDFIRTTEPRHVKGVKAFFKRVYDNGDIYLGDYEGLYCVPCETFWTEIQAPDRRCPDCGRPTEVVREKSYFFRMSKYQERLLRHIEENPDFISPASRRNEIVSFVKSGLRDLSISRTTFRWGIEVPTDPEHVIYVWFDALVNYISVLGYGGQGDVPSNFWPADVHLIGKDILRFHTVYWPTFLMSAGLPLPKRVFGHGWWTVEGKKMSKSLANVVEPNRLIDEYGADPLRYFLLREVPFGLDGDFSHLAFIHRINSDLANDLGNLFNRVLTMTERYCGGCVPSPSGDEGPDRALKGKALGTWGEVDAFMNQLSFDRALRSIWELVGGINKYIDDTAPWALAKKEGSRERLGTVLYNAMEAMRGVALLVSPFMPQSAGKMWAQLGMEGKPEEQVLPAAGRWGLLPVGARIKPGEQIFPRIEEEQAMEISVKVEREAVEKKEPELISMEEFQRLDLRVGVIKSAERVEKAKKLLKLRVDIGAEERTMVAGIAECYTPEDLLNKQVVVVANLQPANIRGIESQGMLLAAGGGEKIVLVTLADEIEPGAKVR